jgi:hypothetical protein
MVQMRNPAEQGGASGSSVHAAKLNTSEDTHPTATNQVLCSSLTGSDCCSAVGITVTGYAPVLELSRRLVEAGHDPATALHVYRGATLALTVRSIGEAAQLEINSKVTGFTRRQAVRTGPPVRLSTVTGSKSREGQINAPGDGPFIDKPVANHSIMGLGAGTEAS